MLLISLAQVTLSCPDSPMFCGLTRALRTIVSAEAAKQSVFDLGLPAVSQD
jgi:hypothetical protein